MTIMPIKQTAENTDKPQETETDRQSFKQADDSEIGLACSLTVMLGFSTEGL